MAPAWRRYDSDPQIGPLIEAFRQSQQELEYLKADLRTPSNMEGIVRVSEEQTSLKRYIDRLVSEQESILADARNHWWGSAIAAAALFVGLLNLGVYFGLF